MPQLILVNDVQRSNILLQLVAPVKLKFDTFKLVTALHTLKKSAYEVTPDEKVKFEVSIVVIELQKLNISEAVFTPDNEPHPLIFKFNSDVQFLNIDEVLVTALIDQLSCPGIVTSEPQS